MVAASPPSDAPHAQGAWLATRHAAAVTEATGEPRLIHYAESPRVGDWTLRSALVRYAQVRPAAASAVLELVRRTDTALHGFARLGERTTVTTRMTPVASAGGDDARATDVARAIDRAAPRDPRDELLAGYLSVTSLDDDEIQSVHLYGVALLLDRLADALTDWAHDRSIDRPDAAIEAMSRAAFVRLGELGVERESRPRGRGRAASS